ncbi:DUF3072 domain-containing protein [Mesorhizobium sp. M7A.F.Ca.US.010.02.1.1]|nr:DUF3072 domain-containing protein [Mesorhizobium sp. M7A.F.Ca.US.010.02.1.1]
MSKYPDEWTTGNEPMTRRKVPNLKTCEQASDDKS